MGISGTPLVQTGERRWGDSLIYELFHLLGSPFSFDLMGYENIQSAGPAIFLANHLGSIGPIQAILSIPVRFYPWVIAEMMDFKQAPQYLFDDFIHPVLHLKGRLGLLFSTLLTRITVRLFRSIGAVSIDRFGGLSSDGFRHSLRLLREGKNLLIFPEDPLLPFDPQTGIRPFMPGFATLCHLFDAERCEQLPVFPIAIHASSEMVAIGKAECFSQKKNRREDIDDFCLLMEHRVKSLYRELQERDDDELI